MQAGLNTCETERLIAMLRVRGRRRVLSYRDIWAAGFALGKRPDVLVTEVKRLRAAGVDLGKWRRAAAVLRTAPRRLSRRLSVIAEDEVIREDQISADLRFQAALRAVTKVAPAPPIPS